MIPRFARFARLDHLRWRQTSAGLRVELIWEVVGAWTLDLDMLAGPR